MLSETNFSADLLMRSEIAVDRSWETPLDSAASRVTVSDIVPPRSSDGFLNAERILVKVSEGATASEKIAVVFLLWTTRSDISEARFSEIPLAPLKSLATASAMVGVSVNDLNRTVCASCGVGVARSADVVLNPVKSLATASEIAGLSDDALNPLKTLPARSEGATASERKLKVPLLTVSDIREARFSETPLAPLKTLATESATVGISVSVLNPAKTLPMTSEGTTLSSSNFPAPLLTESAIETTSDSDLGTPLFTTSEIATASEKIAVVFLLCSTRSDISEEMFSEIPLAPLKSLPAASEIGGASDRDFTRPLFTTSEIVDARFSDVVLTPVKS